MTKTQDQKEMVGEEMNLEMIINKAPDNIKKEFIYRKYPKGSFIIHPFEDNNYLYILNKGSAEVFRQISDGSMISLYKYQSYSCFGEVEIFNKDIKTLSVTAKTNCETIAIHRTFVYEWMRQDFNFTSYLMEHLAAKLITSSETVAKLSLLTVKDRILYSIHAHYKIGDLETVTKSTLSSEVCAPIRSLNRSISECINENYIDFKEKRFKVVSLKKLENHLEKIF
ncbi:CRP/FNR family cyclic AMP-dependent transcriptional regulator [Peribacillus sp. B2I2]|uniref:Crp/Fnr family transcriptional regulator n=1 Tax=Peribacillus sp. B2I2 TaxID=3156468 RepID=UPI0035175F9D